MKENNDIEQLFRGRFEGYRVPPSSGLWQRVLRRLRWRDFLHFSPRQLNIWYVTALLTAGIAAYLYFHDSHTTEERQAEPLWQQTLSAQENHVDTIVQQHLPVKKERGGTSVREAEHAPQSQSSPLATSPSVPGASSGGHSPSGEKAKPDNDTLVPSATSPRAPAVRQEESSSSVEPASPPPVASFTLSPSRGCVPLKVDFINHSEHAVSYRWWIRPGDVVLHQKHPVHTFETAGTYVVILTVSDQEGRTAVHADTVRVYAAPEAGFDYLPKDAKVPDEEISFYNTSQGAVRYFWSFGDGHSSEETDPVHRYTLDGPFDVMLVAWSAEGCADTVVKRGLFENSSYYIRFPNAFIANPNGPTGGYYTPGSLSNDVFHPVWEGVEKYHLQIFNRRGELVFESRDLYRGWDGYVLDRLAAPGVYVWKANGTFTNGKPYVRFGNVTLIRKK